MLHFPLYLASALVDANSARLTVDVVSNLWTVTVPSECRSNLRLLLRCFNIMLTCSLLSGQSYSMLKVALFAGVKHIGLIKCSMPLFATGYQQLSHKKCGTELAYKLVKHRQGGLSKPGGV